MMEVTVSIAIFSLHQTLLMFSRETFSVEMEGSGISLHCMFQVLSVDNSCPHSVLYCYYVRFGPLLSLTVYLFIC
jgi:hypothetical protein